MKLAQFKKKVANEFAKSPAKTATLLALCPVALYFIVPLFWGAKSRGIQAQKAQVITKSFDPTIAPAVIAPTVQAAKPGPTWRQWTTWSETDARRTSGVLLAGQRSPFRTPAVEVVDEATAPPEPTVSSLAKPAFSPEAFAAIGFKLTGTVMGRLSRSATINGRRYAEGAVVTPRMGQQRGPAPEQGFVLKQVLARHAVLELDGQQFLLKLDTPPPASSGITIVRRPSGNDN